MKTRFAALVAALAVGGCASSSAPPASLEEARAQVQAAIADPAVQRHAQRELDGAQDAFANAERGARRQIDAQVIEHWSYLARQRAATAREVARLRSAEAEIRAAQDEPRAPPPSASGSPEPSRAPGGPALVLADDQFIGNGLRPDATPGIERVARLLEQDPSRMVRVDGHSDDVNDRGRSIEFSGRRAESVRGELVRLGIDPSRVAVRALGDSFPVASNDTAIGRQRNRRVDVYVFEDGAGGRAAP